jgi:hypothetical protein
LSPSLRFRLPPLQGRLFEALATAGAVVAATTTGLTGAEDAATLPSSVTRGPGPGTDVAELVLMDLRRRRSSSASAA